MTRDVTTMLVWYVDIDIMQIIQHIWHVLHIYNVICMKVHSRNIVYVLCSLIRKKNYTHYHRTGWQDPFYLVQSFEGPRSGELVNILSYLYLVDSAMARVFFFPIRLCNMQCIYYSTSNNKTPEGIIIKNTSLNSAESTEIFSMEKLKGKKGAKQKFTFIWEKVFAVQLNKNLWALPIRPLWLPTRWGLTINQDVTKGSLQSAIWFMY